MISKGGEMSEQEQSSTTNIQIENLFDTTRLVEKFSLLKLIFYFPVGVVLLLVRLIIGCAAVILLALLPETWNFRSTIYKGVCKVVGITVQVDDKHFDENVRVLISNHVSILDRMAINFLVSCSVINGSNKLGFWHDADTLDTQEDLPENDITSIKRYIEDSTIPTLMFPENAMTNGKVGMLKFSNCPFSLNLPIQPIVIHVSVSTLITIPPSVLESHVLLDTLWLLFLPCTAFSLKVLPSVTKSHEESVEEFSKRIQKVMAEALALAPTVYSVKDKIELIKRMRTSRSITSPNSASTKLERQCSSQLPSSSNSSLKESYDHEFVLQFSTAAKTFGKSPKDRMQSYQERKAVLIESARIRYLKKKEEKCS